MAQALRADAGRPRSGLAAAGEEGASSLPLHGIGFAPLRAPRLVQMTSRSGKTPRSRLRPPPLTVLSAPAGPGGPIQLYTPVHTSSGGNGWTQTQHRDDRQAHQPQGRPRTPIPHRSLVQSRLLNAGSERPESGGRGREVFDSCDLPQSFPVMQRWVGWASRDRRGADQAVDARQTPLGRKWKERSGEKVRNRESKGENRGLIPSYLISDLPETHVHACQRRYRNGVRGLPSHPPVAVHSRRPRVAPSWARPHSW